MLWEPREDGLAVPGVGEDLAEEITFVLKEEYKFKGDDGMGWRFSRLKGHGSDRGGWEESPRLDLSVT